MEEWRPIPGIEGYEVSDLGRVRSLDRVVVLSNGNKRNCRGRILAPGKSSNGYWTVVVGGSSYCIHELVLLSFIGPCPVGKLAFHDDDNRTNNVLSNLSWKTPSQNNKNITKMGKRMFTYEEADLIRKRLREGEDALALSIELGCTRRHIYHIKNGVQYAQG